MAWIARIINVNPISPLQTQIEVGYFDDEDPRNNPAPMVFLHRRTYSTSEVTDVGSFVAAVQDEGKRARAAHRHMQDLNATLGLGAQVAIEEGDAPPDGADG